MSDGGTRPNEDHASIDGRADEERLRDVVREREERLAELTDQSLEILDRLAEARRHVRELEAALLDRDAANVQLRGLLEDLRRRVRSTRVVGGTSRAAGADARVEVVLWPTSVDLVQAWVDRAAAHVPADALVVLCPGAARPEPGRGRVFAADQRWPGHLWNLGMAVTEAPYVLFIAEGVAPRADIVDADLGDVDAESVALGQPVLERAGADPTAGLRETHHLHLEPRPFEPDEKARTLEFAAPEAFLVRRAAYERLGPFDEDLRGVDALTEYALRASALDFRVVECPSLALSLAPDVDLSSSEHRLERDRLLILAQHRPAALGEAITASDPFSSLGADQLGELLRAVFQRLSDHRKGGDAIELLVRSGVEIARRSIDRRAIDEQLVALERTIDGLRAIEAEEPRGREAADLENRARALTDDDPRSRLARADLLLQAQAREKQRLTERLTALRVRLKEITEEATRALDVDHQNALKRAIAADQRAATAVSELNAMRDRAFGLHEQVADARARLREIERVKNDEIRQLDVRHQERLDEIHQLGIRHQEKLDEIAAVLDGERGCSAADVVARAALVAGVLRDRERWLVSLLDEMASRVLPRRLRPEERSFLAERRPAGDA